MKKKNLISLPSFREEARRDPEHLIIQENDIVPTTFLVSYWQGKFFCIKTYGCQANIRDSEKIRNFLFRLGMRECPDFSGADMILFNTCAIRENAANHLFGELGRAKRERDKNKDLYIGVFGCLMQEEKALNRLLEQFSFINLVFGTNNLYSFYELLEKSLRNDEMEVAIYSQPSYLQEGIVEKEGSRYSKYTAYVDITYGCDKFCTYCIVPYTRGKERSRRMEDIIAEVNCLKEKGYKQVTLLGQNVDSYGKDFGDSYAFATLLENVAKTGIERIRFTTPYPSDFNTKVFDVMAKYKNVMPALHLPIQSGSDRILKLMNRRYTREEYLNIVRELKKRLPDVYLTTDIIVAFPHETEEDFLETLSICEECSYDGAFTFIFSPRPMTPASKMKDDIPLEVKQDRFNRLKDLIDSLTEKRAKTFVGTIQKVLFEEVSKRDKNMISGYDEHGKLVHVKGDSSLIGQIKEVKIVESHTYSLIGELYE